MKNKTPNKPGHFRTNPRSQRTIMVRGNSSFKAGRRADKRSWPEFSVRHPLVKYSHVPCIFKRKREGADRVVESIVNTVGKIWKEYICRHKVTSPGVLMPFCSSFSTAATGDIPAYQLRSPNSGLAQSIVMAASPGTMQSPSSQHAEEITRKREVRLMKNR